MRFREKHVFLYVSSNVHALNQLPKENNHSHSVIFLLQFIEIFSYSAFLPIMEYALGISYAVHSNLTEQQTADACLSMCAKHELLECTDIGATTFAKFHIELTKKAMKSDCKSMYSVASISLPVFLFNRRLLDGCFMSFRIRESNGYVVNTVLLPKETVYDDPVAMIRNNLSKRKLHGKFVLEVLFVDAEKIGDVELTSKYVANINVRMRDISDVSCLKDKVKKAEKWLNMAKKKKASRKTENGPVSTSQTAEEEKVRNVSLVMAMYALKYPRFQSDGFLYLEKWSIGLPSHMFEPKNDGSSADRAAFYALFATQAFKMFFAGQTKQNTHNMFEFMTKNGRRIVTKLRPHIQNSEDMIAQTLRLQDGRTLTPAFNLSIYTVQVPAFASVKSAPSLLNFVRKIFERVSLPIDFSMVYAESIVQSIEVKDNVVKSITLEECSQLNEKRCDCKKLHVSSYCDELRMLFHKKSTKMAVHSWQIGFSDLCSSLFDSTTAADLYSRIANRICRNKWEEFRVGTNIQCEVMIGEKMYSTELSHHSDIQQDYIRKEMFKQDKEVDLVKKIVVTVYLVDILTFASNENAHECLNKLRSQKDEVGGSNITLPNEPKVVMKKERKTMQKTTGLILYTTIIQTTIPLVHERKASIMLDSSYFKMYSSLAIKASAEYLTVQDAYKIVSSHISMNTCKSRIMLIQVELNPQFYEEADDCSLLMAEILLDIANSNEIGRFSGKKKKLVVRFSHKGFPIQMVLNKAEHWNSKYLKEAMLLYGGMDYPKQFYLDVQYRLM